MLAGHARKDGRVFGKAEHPTPESGSDRSPEVVSANTRA